MVVVLYGTLAIINRVTRLVVTYFYSVFSQCIFFKGQFSIFTKISTIIVQERSRLQFI